MCIFIQIIIIHNTPVTSVVCSYCFTLLKTYVKIKAFFLLNIMSRKTSIIWDYFIIVEGDKAKCNFCKTVLKFNQSSTTNLIRHIRSKHVTVDLSKRRRPNDDLDEENIDDPSPMSTQNPSTSISMDRQCPPAIAPLALVHQPARSQQQQISNFLHKPVAASKRQAIDQQVK